MVTVVHVYKYNRQHCLLSNDTRVCFAGTVDCISLAKS